MQNSYAKELTILYTGSTHAMLYPCSCPVEQDGGVSRRMSLVESLRKKSPDSILLDSGNFFAGGLMDEYTQSTELNLKRTEVNLEAMQMMKYDAALISDDEFNFGMDFLKEKTEKINISFLSANAAVGRVSPYIIKEKGGVRIGIIGLTNRNAKQKAVNLDFADPQSAAEKAVKELKEDNGVDIVILLSSLNEKDNIDLVNAIKGIDIVILAQPAKEDLFKKIGDTLFVFPSWQGRKLGVLKLNLKDKKISGYKVDLERLSDEIKDDRKMQEILPRCFSDINCKENNVAGTCLKPGAMDSSCQFAKAKQVKLLVITSKNCVFCDTEKVISWLKNAFPGLTAEFLYFPDKKSSKLVNDLKIEGLPAYLLPKDIKTEKAFDGIKNNLELKKDYYLVKQEFSGVSYYLNREKRKDVIDLFIGLYDQDAGAVLEAIREFNPDVHFLAIEQDGKFDSKGGKQETEEYLRSVCVKKYYPNIFWDYLICRTKEINSSWWDSCLGDYDPAKIKTCATSAEGAELLKENIKLNKELKVIFGPVYLVDNQQVFSTSGAPTKGDFKKIFKK
ncbi:MAG: hypothetical protein FJZ15_07355 [Candidatus Omnitrophica bacterium]|nr:hypothetical protein [Candidatus Omnitrophota bacterium]